MKKRVESIGKRYFKVEDSVFHRTVHVLLNHSEEEFVQWQKRKGVINAERDQNAVANFEALSTSISSDSAPTEWIIHVKHFEWTIDNQGSLLHEVVHTVIKIFQMNNIPFNADTQEFIAHMIENLYTDIAAKLFRLTKKKRK